MTDEPIKLYTVAEAATILKISTRTLWRYIDGGMFEFLVIVPRVERRRVLFTQQSFDAFNKRFSAPSNKQTEEKPKRVYNRTAKKYARKKATGKRKKAA